MLPTINNDLTLVHVAASTGIFVGGYLIHELMHILPLAAAGVDYRVEFNPGEKPLWWNITFGRTFQFETTAPANVALISLLAPGILTIPGWLVWAALLQSPVVRLSTVVIMGTYIVVLLPSLADWLEAGRQVSRLRG